MKNKTPLIIGFVILIGLMGSLGCAGPLTEREQGSLIGGAAGMGTGAIIGSTAGSAAAGALIGGPVGLVGGFFCRRLPHAQAANSGRAAV